MTMVVICQVRLWKCCCGHHSPVRLSMAPLPSLPTSHYYSRVCFSSYTWHDKPLFDRKELRCWAQYFTSVQQNKSFQTRSLQRSVVNSPITTIRLKIAHFLRSRRSVLNRNPMVSPTFTDDSVNIQIVIQSVDFPLTRSNVQIHQ